MILGGTGAIGESLITLLEKKGHDVFVTSRTHHETTRNIHYIQGDAHDIIFLRRILAFNYDAIVDFMVYTVEEFSKRLQIFLDATNQYVFLSSGRVYAEFTGLITENSPRLLDISSDTEYLATNEYALAKARQENLLSESLTKNWTIIRPYITYSNERLQLGVLEKEQWLYRALHERTIVFSKEIAPKMTTMTYGYDVAKAISEIIGCKAALGEKIQIVSPYAVSWEYILMVYLDTIEEEIGKRPAIQYIENFEGIEKALNNKYQIKYDRLYNRTFDNHKANIICQKELDYSSIEVSLKQCLKEFIKGPKNFKNINWKFEAYADKVTGSTTPLTEIPNWKQKIKYLIYRYIRK